MSTKNVQMARLKNGIPVYFQPDRTSNVVSIVVRAGALKDPSHFLGRAHVHEHFGSNSTRDFTPIEVTKMLRTYSAEYWRGAGIYTTYENTAYGCGLLRRRDYILNLFPLFAQMVRYPNLTHHTAEEIMKIEQGAVICEWALHGEDNIEERARLELLKLLYPNNPVSKRFDCDPDHLMGPSVVSELRKYHDEHYVSSNIAVIILGPDKTIAMNMARRAFSDMPEKQAPPLVSLPENDIYPKITDRLYSEFEYGDKQNKIFHLLFGFPTEPFGSIYSDSLEVLAELLETHIQFAMRDLSPSQHLGTYHPRVWTEVSNLHGTIYVWIPVISQEGAKRAEQVLTDEINRICRGKFLDFGLGTAINKAKTSNERKAALKILKRMGRSPSTLIKRPIADRYFGAFINEPETLAQLITQDFANGVESPEHLNDFKKRMHRVKKASIIDSARKFLNPPCYGYVLAKPINPLNFDRFRQASK